MEFSAKCYCRIWLLGEIKGRAAYKHKSFEKQQKREKSVHKANAITDKGKSQTLTFIVEQIATKTSVLQIILKKAKWSLKVCIEG